MEHGLQPVMHKQADIIRPAAAPDERRQLRQVMRRLRRALGQRQRQQAASALCRHLLGSAEFRYSRHIAFYLANDGEIDLQPLLHRAWAMGKHCYLPVLGLHKRLWFAPYGADTPLRPNQFHIPEPELQWSAMRRLNGIDLVLMPLVAFDMQGNRLGMGGGFYDRTLAYLLQRKHWQKPRLIGTAHEFQQVKQLPSAPWDIPLHGVATDKKFHHFR